MKYFIFSRSRKQKIVPAPMQVGFRIRDFRVTRRCSTRSHRKLESMDSTLNVVNTFVCPFPADNFSKYRKNIIPNKQCIILTHNLLKKLYSNIMHSLFGITFVLYSFILININEYVYDFQYNLIWLNFRKPWTRPTFSLIKVARNRNSGLAWSV